MGSATCSAATAATSSRSRRRVPRRRPGPWRGRSTMRSRGPTLERSGCGPESGPRVVVDDYSIRHAGPGIEVTVHLRRGEETKIATTAHTGGEILQTVANATGACLGDFLPPTITLSVSDIRVLTEGDVPG